MSTSHAAQLQGGEAADVLEAEPGGGQLLTGGDGADRFRFVEFRPYIDFRGRPYGGREQSLFIADFSPLRSPDRITDFSLVDGDRIDVGNLTGRFQIDTDHAPIAENLGEQKVLLWRGAAPEGFRAEPGQRVQAEAPRSWTAELWSFYDETSQRTGLYMDRDADGVASANDLLLWFDGRVVLSAEAFLPGTFSPHAQAGGAGADALGGTRNNDLLAGGDGNDSLHGGNGADVMIGGRGDDIYWIDSVQDVVIESHWPSWQSSLVEGLDWIYSSRSYTLPEGVENGRVIGDAAVNLYGNQHDNLLVAGGGANTLSGGWGVDTVSYALAGAGVRVDLRLTVSQDTVGSGLDKLVGIESLIGSEFADELIGNVHGNDLQGGQGADTLIGNEGNDRYWVDSVHDRVIETEANAQLGGQDWVYSSLASYTLPPHVEHGSIEHEGSANLWGNAANNHLVAGSGDNRIGGSGGVDTVDYSRSSAAVRIDLMLSTAQDTGGSGVDTLFSIENLIGSAYGDRLQGNGLWNRLDGGAGADTLSGGAGNDSYVVDDEADLVIETEADVLLGGVDTVHSHALRYTLPSHVENGVLEAEYGEHWLIGNALDNQIGLRSREGTQHLDGGAGSDTLSFAPGWTGVWFQLGLADVYQPYVGWVRNFEHVIGSAYSDRIKGDAGANRIQGGLGEDFIWGGAGADTLSGGLGARKDGAADQFIFDSAPGADNRDEILGFETGLDLIVLDPAIYAAAIGTQLDASEFRLGSQALDADDRIIFDAQTGLLLFDADGSGAGAALPIARLTGVTQLGEGDFSLQLPSTGGFVPGP